MTTALVGYTGFVGATLDRMLNPTARFRSTNIDDIRGQSFEHVICAGVQAKKWWANLYPDEDWAGITRLLDALASVKSDRFTLISTIDVYPEPRYVDENTSIIMAGHHPYGLNRLKIEWQIRECFSRVVILRLPALFGPGLKKNVIFDMLTNNQLDKVHPDSMFQYYDTRRLAGDISRAWEYKIDLINVTSEPVATSEIRDRYFLDKQLRASSMVPIVYDMRSLYDYLWNGSGGYLYSLEQVMRDLGDYLRSIKYL